ncbi:MAG: Unknown protein [uncultured Thiotrichaceae bacterium]|uniref:Uncharacterized protein n=1 Tax=uncultured Thiotrichaceae bacterium TaxID=298394 RepID=A0A6S6T703_9GAMM|nr:MAG: Unknown protein [uncultured Thiotrichaceae bacterium]
MPNSKRQLYRSYLQVLTIVAILFLLIVLLRSLFQGEPTQHRFVSETNAVTVVVDLADLVPGQIHKLRLKKRPVGVLYRRDYPSQPRSADINNDLRSIDPAYFVFINETGAIRCQVSVNSAATELKDICAGVVFDMSGRVLKGSAKDLDVPPHYFNNKGQLVVGQWSSEKSF